MRSIFSSPKIDTNLDKHYYGAGRVLAEGGGDDLYLVDGDDKFHKIEAKGHTTDVKNLGAGRRLTEGDNYWFGPRLFPFDDKSSSKGNSLDTFKATLALVKKQSREELKQLSAHLQNMDDDSMCEVLDVMGSCDKFKEKLVGERETIKSALTGRLEQGYDAVKGVELTQKLTEILPRLTPLLSDTVRIQGLSMFQGGIGRYGIEGMRQGVQPAHNENSSKRVPTEILFPLGSNNRDLGGKCQNSKTSNEQELFKRFFEECNDEKKELSKGIQVTNVLKAGSACCFNDRQTFGVAKRRAGGSGRKQHLIEPKDKELYGVYGGNFKGALLTYKGIVDEECKNLSTGGFDVLRIERKFCHEVMKSFFGSRVNEKL